MLPCAGAHRLLALHSACVYVHRDEVEAQGNSRGYRRLSLLGNDATLLVGIERRSGVGIDLPPHFLVLRASLGDRAYPQKDS